MQTRNGWNVGQAAEVVAAAPLSFEQAQERVRKELWVERSSGTWRPGTDPAPTSGTWLLPPGRSGRGATGARGRPLPGMGTALAGGPAREAGSATADRSIGGTDTTGNRSTALWLAVQSVLAVALLAFGHWGYRNAHRLTAAALSSDQRARCERTYRRSAVACQIVAGVFAAVTVAMAVTGIS